MDLRNRKIIYKVIGSLFIIYTISFCVGLYRVKSFTEGLRRKHDILGAEAERLVSTMRVGQSIEEVNESPFLQKEYAPNEYIVSYLTIIEETSSASNRGGPAYFISVTDGVITNISKTMPLSHSDRFMERVQNGLCTLTEYYTALL